MSQQLKTWINPAIDTGERFAAEIVEIDQQCAHDRIAIVVDGVPIMTARMRYTEAHNAAAHLQHVIAAAYEAGREQGRKEH